MNKFRFYFILSIVATVFFSCSTSTTTDSTVYTANDISTQYETDNALIVTYLKTHYIKFTDINVSFTDPDFADKEFTYATIGSTTSQVSLWSYLNSATYPKLMSRTLYVSNVKHTMYYLILREGLNDRPSNVDGVYAGYIGELLDGQVFDSSSNSEQLYNLDGISYNGGSGVIRGWSEFFPFLKSGKYVKNGDGTISYSDYGVGAMFLPSKLAYYDYSFTSSNSITVSEYSPLVFTVKLFGVRRYDHDYDGIPSYLEDLDGDHFMYSGTLSLATDATNPDDTDGDGVPNYLDVDDDGDGVNTYTEIKKPNGINLTLDGPGLYYPYDPIISSPVKSTDEKRGVPQFSSTGAANVDYTSPARLRIHLDKNHTTAF